MNTDFILKKIRPYLNEQREISEAEFIDAFGMLKLREQYEVINIMIANEIDYVDLKAQEDIVGTKKALAQLTFSKLENINLKNEQLCVMYQNGDSNALEMLLIKNENFIYEIALKIDRLFSHKLEVDDLLQEGKIGLMEAANKFDVQKGYTFLTYAWYDIRQFIQRCIINSGYTIRFPAHIFERIATLNRLETDSMINDKISLTKYLADSMDIPKEKVKWLMAIRENIMTTSSLNQFVGKDLDTEIMEFIPDNEIPIEEKIIEKLTCLEIREALDKTLSYREKFILYMRFGIETRQHTLEEVATVLGLTRGRIHQIESKALEKLSRRGGKKWKRLLIS